MARSVQIQRGPTPPFKGRGVRRIDPGITREVKVLWENGIETTESCEGGKGHSFPEPTIRFCGGSAEGYRAVSIALQHGLNISELRRVWCIQDGELNGPLWELTFTKGGR